jgi:hypothetical protein
MHGRFIEKIENLDVTLFAHIPSQTSVGDRRSLLAVQRATGRRHESYAYLEIGSHLGGSIQPYLVDHRCMRIYSIDPRPVLLPDDRSPEYVSEYPENSTERMLRLLEAVDPGGISKIQCFETDASKLDRDAIREKPRVAFIDGEHTRDAVLSDFAFCIAVIAPGGAILFHDFYILHGAIAEIVTSLKAEHRDFTALKLDGNMFGIFLDPSLVLSDPFLREWHRRQKRFWTGFRVKMALRRVLPAPVHSLLRAVWSRLTGSVAAL